MTEITRKDLEEKAILFDVVNTVTCDTSGEGGSFDSGGYMKCNVDVLKDNKRMNIDLGTISVVGGLVDSIIASNKDSEIWIKTDFTPKQLIIKHEEALGDILYIRGPEHKERGIKPAKCVLISKEDLEKHRIKPK